MTQRGGIGSAGAGTGARRLDAGGMERGSVCATEIADDMGRATIRWLGRLRLATFAGTVKECKSFAVGRLVRCDPNASIPESPTQLAWRNPTVPGYLSTTVPTVCRSDFEDWRRAERLGGEFGGGRRRDDRRNRIDGQGVRRTRRVLLACSVYPESAESHVRFALTEKVGNAHQDQCLDCCRRQCLLTKL